EKAPAIDRGFDSHRWGIYILGLQVLPFASHTPPALVQSASVFAVVTSAAKAGAVKANTRAKATIIETNLLMCISSLRLTTHRCGPQELLILRSCRAGANWRCVKHAHFFLGRFWSRTWMQ